MLCIRDLTKVFAPGTPNEHTALDHLDLSLAPGEFVTIIGSNGAGKSTLFSAIGGAFWADSGAIFLDGKNITYEPEHRRSAKIGRLFQDPMKGTAPHMTIEENLALSYSRSRRRGLRMAVSGRDRDFFRSALAEFGMGLEDRMDTKVGLLSGGQRQALTLLMSTIVPPKLLLLDEHTAALDPKSSENVMRLTDELVREKQLTTIMVTHNLKYAVEYGSRLIMMHGGAIVEDRAGREKQELKVSDLLTVFNAISVECGN